MSDFSTYHPIVATIIQLLTQRQLWHEVFEHQPVRTSEEAANLRTGYGLQQGAKAIIVRIKITNANKRFVMLVLPGDRRFDEAKVKTLFGAKDVRFATEAEVLELTKGVQPGGVPPFGNLFGLEVVTDRQLLSNEKIVFNAGDRRVSVAMCSADYVEIVQPKLAEIISHL